MKAKKLLAVDPTRLYTRQEVATMFALTNIELLRYHNFVGASLSSSSPKPISYAKMDARL